MRSCTIRAWRERRRGKNSAAGASRRSDGRAPRAPPGLTAGARPPLPRRWRPREPSARANRPPRGGAGRTAGDAGLGARSFWGGGSVREEAPGRGGASTLRPGGEALTRKGGGLRRRWDARPGGGGGTLGPELGPGTRRPPGTPSPEPGARSAERGTCAASASTRGLRIPAPALTRRTHARARAGPARSVLRPPSVSPSAPQPRLRVTSQCRSPAHPGGGPSGAGS